MFGLLRVYQLDEIFAMKTWLGVFYSRHLSAMPVFSLHTVSVLSAELSLMICQAQEVLLSCKRSMGFSYGFEGADEPRHLYQAALRWSPRLVSLKEEAL